VLDIALIRNQTEAVIENCRARGYDVDVSAVLELDTRRRALVVEYEAARHESRELAKGWKTSADPEAHRRRATELKEVETRRNQELTVLEAELEEQLARLPNMLDARVPIGGEEANHVLRRVNEPPSFDFTPRSHEEIGRLCDVIDIPRGVNAAKTRFYCLKNEAVRMRYALIQMFLEHAAEQGFELVSPPFLARRKTLFASGYLPFNQKDNFAIVDEDLSLIGTSEQALLGMHLEEILPNLPLLYLGDSMCFRTEAGSYGRDTAGILRVHQFFKLEQVVYCHPDEAEKWHLMCLENEEWMMRALGMPYQVVLTASGDLAAPGRIKYDTELWFPSQGKYREATSNTLLGDYQTRRGKIRFKIGKEKGYPHTISATGFTDRLILAILENNQRPDGSVELPEKLVPFMGGQTRIGLRDAK
jgi:seryl-tRNA synthetase